MDVLKKIPHRHFVFSIPKILRRYFLYDRKLLADLSRCAWESLKNLARYIIRASFSQERMQYLDQEGTVVYTSRDGATTRNFPALEWLTAMGRADGAYYGYYSNVSRDKRQKEGLDDAILCILEAQGSEKAFRKSWARLIQKIYEVDPLVCPKTCPEPAEGCQGYMRIISFMVRQAHHAWLPLILSLSKDGW